MKGILLSLCALALVVVLSSDSQAGIFGNRGGGMMCSVAQAPVPPQAKAENLVQTKATRVLEPMVLRVDEPVFATKSVPADKLRALHALNARPVTEVNPKSAIVSK